MIIATFGPDMSLLLLLIIAGSGWMVGGVELDSRPFVGFSASAKLFRCFLVGKHMAK